MRYATFSSSNDRTPRLGAIQGDRIIDVNTAMTRRGTGQAPGTMLALIEQGPDGWKRVRDALSDGDASGATYSTSEVLWHAPIPRPTKNVICIGMNYAAHVREGAIARGREVKMPTVPVFFTKAVTSVVGPHDEVPVERGVTNQVDWEVELGVVIGTRGRNIPRASALDYVFGYTVINDISARDLQSSHQQFFKGKSLDGFCPIGPVIVTADEFGDPQTKALRCSVNDVVKQDSTTADMIFPVDALIEWLSKGLTIEPGELIATGTPQGVGLGRTPPEYLQHGDVVESEVEGIGKLRNRIVDVEP
jgi:2-keto-4-pentenoate hydratase/2-oxohepta-3-ene-1,7-dioic acid hydratase in catechol pathway